MFSLIIQQIYMLKVGLVYIFHTLRIIAFICRFCFTRHPPSALVVVEKSTSSKTLKNIFFEHLEYIVNLQAQSKTGS